jgi:hypothetical protein
MNAIPINQETMAVAINVIWFETPAKALSNPVRLMAYAMTYATHQELQVLRRFVSDDDFREALDSAPPGIIDPRSWATGMPNWADSRRRRCHGDSSANRKLPASISMQSDEGHDKWYP